jgi:2-methylcitrate dehydratase PrpD
MAGNSVPVTAELAAFVHDAPRGCASPRATEVVKHALLDLVGVVIAASDEPASRLAFEYARSQAAAGPATVLGRGVRLAPTLAALVNGTAGHALDYDDIGLGAGHVSVAILPAVFAVSEMVGANGADFIDALVVAYEVAHRLTTMYVDTRLGPYAAGYHKPSVYSVFGATCGAARLLGLTANQTANALGIAASQSGGLRANFGTMTKPLHAGISNRTGVEAALLAGSGFTASTEVLEQRFGWHDVICSGAGDLESILTGLGQGYAIEEGLLFKLYPCCGANHYAIDATIALMGEHALRAPEVARIDVWIERRNLDDVLVYPWPRSPLEGKFSLAYNVAAAVVDGDVTVDTFTDQALARLAPDRERVHVHATAELPQNGARIKVLTVDGRTFEREQLSLRGSVATPLSWSELERKFRANVGGRLSPAAVNEVVTTIEGLAGQPNLAAIGEPLLG